MKNDEFRALLKGLLNVLKENALSELLRNNHAYQLEVKNLELLEQKYSNLDLTDEQ